MKRTEEIKVSLAEPVELELRRLAESRGHYRLATYCAWVLEQHVEQALRSINQREFDLNPNRSAEQSV